jgi:hypothetical protein
MEIKEEEEEERKLDGGEKTVFYAFPLSSAPRWSFVASDLAR